MGKTTFLRAFAKREIEGIPTNLAILHVSQEARGDDTTVLQAVLDCDVERTELLRREVELEAMLLAEAEERGDDEVDPSRLLHQVRLFKKREKRKKKRTRTRTRTRTRCHSLIPESEPFFPLTLTFFILFFYFS